MSTMDKLTVFEDMWGVNPKNPHMFDNPLEVYKMMCKNLKITMTDGMTVPIKKICEKFSPAAKGVIEIANAIDKKDIESKIRVNRVLEMMYYARNTMIGMKRVKELMDISNDYKDNTDPSIMRFTALDTEDNKPQQNVLLYMLEHMQNNRYARYNGTCYEPIYHNGNNTRAWRYVGEIPEVIYAAIDKNTNYEQFQNLTARGDTVRVVSDFLEHCVDSQFPQLYKDRKVFSFTNGVYFCASDTFVSYESGKIPSDTCAAKFFAHEFTSCAIKKEDWRNIETSVLDSILIYHHLEPDVIEWIYAFIGRLMYEINEKDGWQIIFFFQGQAGTGKSTLTLNVCKNLYNDEDVGVLSNNVQRKFGLADICDSLLFVAPEIKRDFSMEQGEFQSIVSGDKVTINVKHQKSRFINWKIPGVLAGNEVPDFIDNSGSIQRRIVTVRFDRRVADSDMTLGNRLNDEMHSIIRKCNCAYLEKSAQFGRTNVWKHLPEYFKKTQSALAQATNPLLHFLANCSRLVFGPEYYVPEKVFVQEFNIHCAENNYGKNRFNPDFYMGPFGQHGIKVHRNQKKRFPENTGPFVSGTFFAGIGIKYNEIEDADDEDTDKF